MTLLKLMRQLAFAGLFYFLPVIVRQTVHVLFGQSAGAGEDNMVLLISAGIWLLSSGFLLLVSRISQYFKTPRLLMGSVYMFSGSVLVTLSFMDALGPVAQLLLLACGMIPQYSVMGVTTQMMMTYAEGPAAAPSAAVYNAVGHIGSSLGPVVLGMVQEHTGSYAHAFLPLGTLLIAAGLMGFLAPTTQYEQSDVLSP